MAGTLFDDQITSAAVRNIDAGSFTKAQIRDDVFIARAIALQSGDNDVEAIAEDRAGNRSVDPSTGEYTVTLDNSPDYDYVYDSNGCLEEVTDDGAAVTTYVYDYENRLVEVKDAADETLAAFTYDAIGRRTTYTNAEGDTTTFVYSGLDVVQEYDGAANTLRREYVYGVGVDNVLRVDYHDGATTSCYYHHDWLGSVTELTNADGEIVQAYEYDAWGTPTIYVVDDAEQPELDQPYLYTGRRWDADTGLYYYRARHYAPHLGRFLQPDPIAYEDGPHLYTYVRNNPVSATDPSGLWTQAKALKVLRRKIGDWRADGYNFAADLLQHFIDKKGPAPYVPSRLNINEVKNDSGFRERLGETIDRFLSEKGANLKTKTASYAFVSSKQRVDIRSKKVKWSRGRMFYTYAGARLTVGGEAQLTPHGEEEDWKRYAESTSWSTFSKAFNWSGDFKITLKDRYTFAIGGAKEMWRRKLARSYAAATFLQRHCGYKPFDHTASFTTHMRYSW